MIDVENWPNSFVKDGRHVGWVAWLPEIKKKTAALFDVIDILSGKDVLRNSAIQ